MSNTFASDVQKQAFMEGVQDEIRSAIPMASVSDVDTKNLETMHNRYGSDFTADTTSDGTYETNDFTYSTDSLTINEQAVYGERIQKKDLVHSGGRNGGWGLVKDRVDRHVRALGVAVHRDTYSKTVNGAGLVLDNEVLGGTASAGTPITMSATNPDDVATKIYELMQDAGLSQAEGNPYLMLDPQTARQFKLFGMNNGFNVADKQLMKGWSIMPSFELDYIITPEVEHEQVLTFTDVNVNTKIVTVKGVSFTSTTTPSTAGQVDVAGTAAAAATLFANAINGSPTGKNSATGYFEVSAANRAILKNAGVKAVADGAVVTITAYGAIGGTTDETNATFGTERKNLLAGLRGSTHLALPSEGYLVDEIMQVPGFTGSELRSTQIFDSTVWTKNANKIAKILVT